ncbi:ras association domain-containing protein 8-like [Tubulanus polymorphus]|uniref:ras association domain-containing protein 8-like n=1 Tax=Tubulanus polymorphus TaxID=672921 RepID=UPI003DA57808
MEFKVWVDGIQRVVCGVTDDTTCQDIIFALAHATGKIGRFSLQEKWRDNERLLVPSEHPLITLRKWGEYGSEVQFVLRHSDKNSNDPSKTASQQTPQKTATFPRKGDKSNSCPSSSGATAGGLPVTNNLKKSLSFSGVHGAPGFQRKDERSSSRKHGTLDTVAEYSGSKHRTHRAGSAETTTRTERDPRRRETTSASPERLKPRSGKKSPHCDSIDRKHSSSLRDDRAKRDRSSLKFSLIHPIPSPRADKSLSLSTATLDQSAAEATNLPDVVAKGGYDKNEFEQQILEQGTYEDLDKLVELQVERLKLQVSQMRIIDSEINFWEEKETEASQLTGEISAEIVEMEEKLQRLNVEQSELSPVSDDLKTEELKTNEVESVVRSYEIKIRDCDKNLADRVKEATGLENDIEREREAFKRLRERELVELERQLRIVDAEMKTKMDEYKSERDSLDDVETEVRLLDANLVLKKKTLHNVEKELKKLNLNSFVRPCVDDIIDEKSSTSQRPGSGRKLANPQSLVEAVPTSKNPHGMWV